MRGRVCQIRASVHARRCARVCMCLGLNDLRRLSVELCINYYKMHCLLLSDVYESRNSNSNRNVEISIVPKASQVPETRFFTWLSQKKMKRQVESKSVPCQ